MADYSRRDFCAMLVAGAAGSLLTPGLAIGEHGGKHRKPNVLFIAVDDLRPQLGCYGNAMARSPHIDRLAAEGCLFERAQCQIAICAPSRASVLTGYRPETLGIYGIHTPLEKACPKALTMPQHFRNHGYETISIGKVYHHHRDDPQGWSKPPIHVRGDWQGRGYLSDEAISVVQASNAAFKAAGKRGKGLGPAFEAADVSDSEYPDGRIADVAIQELQQSAQSRHNDGKPFFLAVGFHKPHLPFNAPKRYWDLYDPAKITLAANPFPPEGVTEYSLTSWPELRQYPGMPKDGPAPDDMARRLIHAYLACVSYVDAQIGRVLAELDRLGLRDDTIVMLWGDHGWKLGEHGAWSKHTNFELDTHAPLIVRAPGAAKAGTRTKALVEFVDMYPSLCDLCQLPVPTHMEGLSFAPLLNNPARPWKTAAFSRFARHNAMGIAMRTDRYRYVEWRGKGDNADKVLARELYDHRQDPGENRNIAGNPKHEALLRQLAAAMARGWRGALPRK